MPSRLQGHQWNTSYRHEDGDLVALFYVPALSRAVQYDRMTGYFSADALALAARGINQLVMNSGKMRLIVGCTLGEPEKAAIAAGYAQKNQLTDADIEEAVARRMAEIEFEPPDADAKDALGVLAFMIAMDLLELRVAVPIDPATKQPVTAPGIYHEKVGVITDTDGNRISFSGSINETRGGWVNNRESFHVHCSWMGEREWKHVDDNVDAFDRQWNNKTASIRTYDFPEAAKQKLLQFLPNDDRFFVPPAPQAEDAQEELEPESTTQAAPLGLLPEEVHEIVWKFVGAAAKLKNGIRVGQVTSAVEPWPHQTQSFLRMWNGWPFRLLESSEVGLGKTIIGGLIIRQAILAGRAKRVLLLVPKAVIIQWQNELYEKFNLNVPIYDGQALHWKKVPGWNRPLDEKVNKTGWQDQPMVLAGSQLMRRKERVGEILDVDHWDLVVLDEAHHARRRGAGTEQEKGPNQLLALMQRLAPKTSSLLLLTATPMQVHPVEIYDLLALLGLPEGWTSQSFLRYFELTAGNPSQTDLAWLASMFQATEQCFVAVTEDEVARIASGASKLTRTKVLKALRDRSGVPLKRLDPEARKVALDILRKFSPVRYRMSRHTRSLLRAYHAKGLLSSPIATRKINDVIVPMTTAERELYQAVEKYISETYDNASREEKNAVGFVMTIYRRRLASSFHALKRTLIRRLERVEPMVTEEDVSDDELKDEVMVLDDALDLATRSLATEEADEIRSLLKMIDKAGVETKAKRLAEKLGEFMHGEYDSAIVFSQFEETVQFLADFLAERMPEIGIGTYSGSGGRTRDKGGTWHSCTKEQIKNALKAKRIQILVATDAAAEGLNLQFVGVIANADLPWNPMRVEQRIGRVDRIGQVHPEIQVINMGYKDTVEADVYLALGERINLFQGIVGKLQPILSRLPQEFEKVALEKPEHREAVRERFLADLENQVTQSEQAAFDVDEVAVDDLHVPSLPNPGLTPESLARAMEMPGVAPAAWEWRRLDPGSCGLRLPGSDEIRVATTGDVFDAHPESMAFFSPGMVAVDGLVCEAESNLVSQPTPLGGVSIHINEESGGQEFEFRAGSFTKRVDTLDDLLHLISSCSQKSNRGTVSA